MSERVFGSSTQPIEHGRRLDEILVEVVEKLRSDAVPIGDRHRANLREELFGAGRLVDLRELSAVTGTAQFESANKAGRQVRDVMTENGERARLDSNAT